MEQRSIWGFWLICSIPFDAPIINLWCNIRLLMLFFSLFTRLKGTTDKWKRRLIDERRFSGGGIVNIMTMIHHEKLSTRFKVFTHTSLPRVENGEKNCFESIIGTVRSELKIKILSRWSIESRRVTLPCGRCLPILRRFTCSMESIVEWKLEWSEKMIHCSCPRVSWRKRFSGNFMRWFWR